MIDAFGVEISKGTIERSYYAAQALTQNKDLNTPVHQDAKTIYRLYRKKNIKKMWVPGRALKPSAVKAIHRAGGGEEGTKWITGRALKLGPGWGQAKDGKTAVKLLRRVNGAVKSDKTLSMIVHSSPRKSTWEYKMELDNKRRAIARNTRKAKEARKPSSGQLKFKYPEQ